MRFTPVTPFGKKCTWLTAASENRAWDNLLVDAKYMGYKDKKEFIKRGYSVELLR